MRALAFILLLVATVAQAQVSFTGGRYVQDFDTLAGPANNTLNQSWANNVTLPGWYSSKVTYTVTDGTLGGSAAAFDSTSTTAQNVGLFSFGAAGSTDRALGSRATTAFSGNSPIYYGVRLINQTGQPITRFSCSFTGEQWFESSATNAHTLTVSYQLGAASLTSGTWTALAGNFTAPTIAAGVATALDGNAAANQRGYAASTGGLNWAPGQELWIRIADSNQTGDEHGLAIDDFVFWAGPGTALFFNGTNQYVTMGPATASLGASVFTLECWFLRTGAGSATSTGSGGTTAIPLITKGRGESDGSNLDCNYFLGIDPETGVLAADFEAAPSPGVTAGRNQPVLGNTPVQMNVWHHAAATYDGMSWRLYLDGVPDGTSTPTGNPQPRADSIQHFAIGSAQNSTGTASGMFQGVIDEVRVWSLARSATQIAAGKNRAIAAPTTGLLARYAFEEGIGHAAVGSVPTAVTGSLVNAPAWVSGVTLATNVTPSVTLTAPSPGGQGTEPVNLLLTANASDSDGAIAKVEFFAGGTKVGEDVTAPYEFLWTGVVAGSYPLIARAIDDSGAAIDSAPVTCAVAPGSNQRPNILAVAPAMDATNLEAPATLQVSLYDAENDPLVVKFYGRRAPPAPGPTFTLVTLPDTQFYSENIDGTRAAIFHSQTQWIVDQRASRRIAFVSHMGDFVQNGDKGGDPSEWLVADSALTRLENHASTLTAYGIPWGGAPGNHDTSPNGNPAGASVFFNQFFGTARFAIRSYYGGRYGSDNNNNYEFFSASGLDFIVLHLAYRSSADQGILDWADALLKAHPNRRAIVTSHWLLGTGNPAPWGGAAQAIYEELKDNPNFFLMLCGHIHGEGQRSDTYFGRTVHSVLQDYQGRANGGDGWLRFYEFSPATNTIRARTYSTTLGQFETDADSDFSLPYDMQSAMGPWVELSSTNLAGGVTSRSYVWPGLETGKDYEWYATAFDGIHTVKTAPRRFAIRPDAPPTITLTSPNASAAYTQPVNFTISANAADSDGTIARVEFYQGTTRLGQDTVPPYEIPWSNISAGQYTLTAIARDNAGNATVSTPLQITVNASGTLRRGPYMQKANHHSLVVRWRSSAPVAGRVRYGTSPTALDQFVDETAPTLNHAVQLTGLAPYTRYYYSIGSAFDILAGGDLDHTFRTSPDPGSGTETRIWILGDCGGANPDAAAVRDAYSGWMGNRRPDFTLLLGDNAYIYGTDADYQAAVFNMYPDFLRRMPFWSCIGNHETNIDPTNPEGGYPYFDIFTFPMAGECGGVPSGTESYYSFDYGQIHFVCLDSMISSRAPDGPMAAWLQADLASTTKPWIVAFFHHPPYSKGSHDSDVEVELIEMRTNFGPILEAGGVDLVLTGHSHSYERSFFLDAHYGNSTTFSPMHRRQPGDGRPTGDGAYRKPLTGPRDHFGAVYAVTGSASGLTGGSLDHPAMFVSYNHLGSMNLDISGNRLDASFIEADGSVTDSFTIVKQGAADSDGDGIPDAYEIAHGLNRHNPADALLDADFDGLTNRDEYVLGLLISTPDRYQWSVERQSPNVTIHIPTTVGRTYRVWFSTDLLTWLPASANLPGTGQELTWTDTGTTTGSVPTLTSRRFYRVQVTAP